jgi:hypothetical protein
MSACLGVRLGTSAKSALVLSAAVLTMYGVDGVTDALEQLEDTIMRCVWLARGVIS